jgi:hypothetical protein
MKSRTTDRFRACFARLSEEVQGQAREAYARFIENPSHPSLRYKRVHSILPVYSVRISLDYRAVGVRDGDEMIWFWIGPHAEYERLLTKM